MVKLLKNSLKISETINRINNGEREYLLISDFGNSSVKSQEGFYRPYFRIFEPVKPSKGRKLSSEYDQSFNPFKDSLMDYPTIVANRLGKNENLEWEQYNRLISIHVSRCPINCWHCYLEECMRSECGECSVNDYCKDHRKLENSIKEDWYSAKTIVDDFVAQRVIDKEKGISSNILRITGGEPFLTPYLVLEILNEIDKRDLCNEIFLWTETNLIPFCVSTEGDTIVPDELLKQLSSYKNLCIHPCFHGVDEETFEEITGKGIKNFNMLFDALERLIAAEIDIYPTLGSNVIPVNEIYNFYKKLAEIDNFLPLRFCLIEYDLNYDPIKWRFKNIPSYEKHHNKVFDRYQVITKWNELLKQNLQIEYGMKPRHLVKIDKGATLMIEEKMVHLFKWPSICQYQELLLRTIALPVGAIGKLFYSVKYVNGLLIREIDKINKQGDVSAVFWVLSLSQLMEGQKPVGVVFNFAYPLRQLIIKSMFINDENMLEIIFIAQEFIQNAKKYENINDLENYLDFKFGSNEIPNPGQRSGFAYIGPKTDVEKCSSSPSLENIYDIIKDIPSLQHPVQQNVIKDYPLLRVNRIHKSTLGKDGRFGVKIKSDYELEFSLFQPDEYRDKGREVGVNEKKFIRKSVTDCIIFDEIKKSKDALDVNVRCKDINYSVPIYVTKKVAWYNLKITPLIILLILIGAAITLFFCYVDFSINPTDKNRIIFTFLTPLIVLFLSKFIEVIFKKE